MDGLLAKSSSHARRASLTPQVYCEQRTRGSGSSFFYAFLFLPEQQRRAMMALYAFCREVDDIADEIKDRDVARTKLAFWQQQTDLVFDPDRAAHHPVARELQWVRDHFPIEQDPFNAMIRGMQHDIDGKPIRSDEELDYYCYRVAGTVGLLTIAVFGAEHPKSTDFAIALGRALQLTNILRDVAADARNGRIYLPQQTRIRFQVTDQDLIDGNLHNGMKELLQHYGDAAKSAYQHALDTLPEQDRRALRASLTMGAIYHCYLHRLRKVQFDVWRHPVTISPLRKIWVVWRMWRRESHADPTQPARFK